ncbi:hypothetical protein SKAU_G00270740 [Synaphobranchus kaupii]|uniref:Uncharacterized protein n=1 Tax=Synaphobranchus kaupii TaxID=118154 RepID=A0A9Q1F0F2_SYNKA|nr:hypothetical protein SKAU_G00270740 [Synaphobranchus kaupii]
MRAEGYGRGFPGAGGPAGSHGFHTSDEVGEDGWSDSALPGKGGRTWLPCRNCNEKDSAASQHQEAVLQEKITEELAQQLEINKLKERVSVLEGGGTERNRRSVEEEIIAMEGECMFQNNTASEGHGKEADSVIAREGSELEGSRQQDIAQKHWRAFLGRCEWNERPGLWCSHRYCAQAAFSMLQEASSGGHGLEAGGETQTNHGPGGFTPRGIRPPSTPARQEDDRIGGCGKKRSERCVEPRTETGMETLGATLRSLEGPEVKRGEQSAVLQDPGTLKRVARMSPLWRIIGSKPHGAYCQDHYECSTQICRDGHCSFSHAVHSKK